MAIKILRPGTWAMVNGSGGTLEFEIDYQKFDVAGNSTVEFESKLMVSYDDTNLTPLRNPPTAQTVTSATGEYTLSTAPSKSISKKR